MAEITRFPNSINLLNDGVPTVATIRSFRTEEFEYFVQFIIGDHEISFNLEEIKDEILNLYDDMNADLIEIIKTKLDPEPELG